MLFGKIRQGDCAAGDRLWLRGGFPESYLAQSDLESLRWRQAFVRNYLERKSRSSGRASPP